MTSYLCTAENTIPDTNAIKVSLNVTVDDYNTLEIKSEDGKSIGIDNVREVTGFISKKPIYGTRKLIIIFDAHKLTHEAQNALLKTFEEHPEYADVALVSRSEAGLLETVLSRCKKIRIKTARKKEKKSKESYKSATSLRLGERGALALKLSKKEKYELIDILHTWLNEARMEGKLLDAELITNTIIDLDSTNVNTRLALEVMIFKLN